MDRFYFLNPLIPANTPIATPVTTPWALAGEHLAYINITVPDGHNGLTGIRILWSGQQIIPWANNQYLIANNRTVPITVDEDISESGLSVVAYNTDVFDHNFYLEALVADRVIARQSMAEVVTPGVAGVSTEAGFIDPLSPAFLIATVPPQARVTVQPAPIVRVPIPAGVIPSSSGAPPGVSITRPGNIPAPLPKGV